LSGFEAWLKTDLLFHIFLIATVAADAAYGESHPRALKWGQHPALGWDDFKGRPRRNTGEPSAVTDTGFRAQLECRNGALDIRVEAEFYINSSWVKPGRKSAELLRHEQGHFDLTEVYARKIKKAIEEAKIGCADDRQAEAAGKKIFDRLDQEWEKAEKQYDAETRDGTDLVKQGLALEKIARDLADLIPIASAPRSSGNYFAGA
jgi:hypothetical protein